MKKKYQISLRVNGENPRALGTRQPNLPRAVRWLGMKLDLGSTPQYEWIGFGSFEKGQVLHFDRDQAKWIMSMILSGSHRERSAWITQWDVLKMVACIPVSPTDVLEKDGRRHALLRHATYAEIALHDVERDFTVFRQELDFFANQGLRLLD